MKTFTRILAVALCLVMCLSVLGVTAFAAVNDEKLIDTSKTGSITVHKYEYNGSAGTPGNGTSQTPPDGATPLKDVEFTLYKVMNQEDLLAYYAGDSATTVTVNDYVTEGKINENAAIGEPMVLTTNDAGIAAFSNLDLGMYVLIETKSPDKVTIPANPVLISVPMTYVRTASTTGETSQVWLYEIHVYPKNSTSEGNVTLKKVDKLGNAISGVTFKLEKKNGDDWALYESDKESYTTDGSGEIKWQALPHGEYRITELSAPAGYIVDKTPICFTVTDDNQITCTDARIGTGNSITGKYTISLDGAGTSNLTITMKNEKPEVTKKVTENTTPNPGVGKDVSYTVTVEIPANIKDLESFVLEDAPTNLSVKTNTVKVYPAGGTNTINASFYSVTYSEGGFTLTFVPEDLGDFAGGKLDIKYEATVLESAATDGSTKNSVTLTYNDGTSTYTTPKVEIEQKYYTIDITKYKDAVAEENKAEGVEFKLYSDATLGTQVKVTGADGVYVYNDAAGSNTNTLVTANGGKLVISGLPAGTYYLKETKAPDDYNLLKDVITITVGEDAEGVTNGTYTQNIINKKGFNLPTTGGLGTLMFIVIGGVLIAGGICLITVPKKKRSA